LLRADLDCIFTLEGAGLSLHSVPPNGARVPVKTVVSQNKPVENESVIHDGVVSEALARDVVRAASVTGLRLAGVDVITADPSGPLTTTGGVILEVNGSPGLHYHYRVCNADQAVPVAALILNNLLQ
jgi:cyanophycin synthetase